MKKEIFVVRVDDYFPALCDITLPTIERYANKIGAKFTIIAERKFPEFPPTYEKMQVYDLGRDNDWNILLDCDMAINDMYDVTEIVTEGHVGVWMDYDPRLTIEYDDVIPLDGSVPIVATNFVASRREHHEIWKPLQMSYEEAASRMKRLFVIDEYCVSRNIISMKIPISGLAVPGAENNLFIHCNITTDSNLQDSLKKIQTFL